MTKDEIKQALLDKKTIYFEGWTCCNGVFQCDCNDGDIECCYETFSNDEDTFDHLSMMCNGNFGECWIND